MRRKKYFVDPEIQKPLVKKLLIFWCVALILSGLIYFGAFYFAIYSVDLGRYARIQLINVFKHAAILYIIFFAIMLLIGYFVLLRLSNRIAGPISRIKKMLAEGNIEELKSLEIRQRDFLHSFIEALRGFVQSVLDAK